MSEEEPFSPLTDALDDLTARLGPPERKQLASRVATDLRSANARRIAANVTPDGEPMVPRKVRRRDLKPQRMRTAIGAQRKDAKSGRMFRAAFKPRYLSRSADSEGATIGFNGAMARIMNVHQYGLRDTVTRDPRSPAITYPARPSLGLPPDDRLRILARVEEHLD